MAQKKYNFIVSKPKSAFDENTLEMFWQMVDAQLSKKKHPHYIYEVNGRYYEIVRKYKQKKK